MRVSELKQEGSTVYLDPSTVRRNRDLVKLWTLVEFKTIQNNSGEDRIYHNKRKANTTV